MSVEVARAARLQLGVADADRQIELERQRVTGGHLNEQTRPAVTEVARGIGDRGRDQLPVLRGELDLGVRRVDPVVGAGKLVPHDQSVPEPVLAHGTGVARGAPDLHATRVPDRVVERKTDRGGPAAHEEAGTVPVSQSRLERRVALAPRVPAEHVVAGDGDLGLQRRGSVIGCGLGAAPRSEYQNRHEPDFHRNWGESLTWGQDD